MVIFGMITTSFNERGGLASKGFALGTGCEGEQPLSPGFAMLAAGREKNGVCTSAKPFPAALGETKLQKTLSCRVSQGLS